MEPTDIHVVTGRRSRGIRRRRRPKVHYHIISPAWPECIGTTIVAWPSCLLLYVPTGQYLRHIRESRACLVVQS